jgi:dTMP kinase
MNKFVAIEGIDGSGKSVQIQLLIDFLERKRIEYKCLHFPKVDSSPYGEMIARFLRGEFGEVKDVNPYLVGLLFALDRQEAKDQITKWLSRGFFVIVDRYVYSNIAFQCAKLDKPEAKAQLRKWIYHLEYKYHNIPKPILSVFLHVPFQFVVANLVSNRNGYSRTYLNGRSDIHESDLPLQESVQREYLSLVNSNDDFCLIDCSSPDGKVLSADAIHKRITELLARKGILER